MEKIQTLVNAILGAAVVALFVLFFRYRPQSPKASEAPQEAVAQGELLPIAIINTDSILKHYTLAIESTEKLMNRYEESTVKLHTKAKSLQKEVETFQRDVMDFQRKLEANAFLSRERAESEQQRLIKKQQDLENREAQLTQEIMLENQQLQAQLADTILGYLKALNAEGRYQMIFSNNAKDNILLSAEGYDITPEVVSALNARYTPAKKK